MFRSPFAARRLGRAPRRSFLPRLEILEDRLTPAGYSPTDLGTPGDHGAAAVGINDSGQIVASAFTTSASDSIGSYLYNLSSNGQGWQLLNPPSGYTQTFPKGINNAGQVLVDAETQGGSYQVFLYNSSNGWTNLNAPSKVLEGFPQGLNDAGQVFINTQAQNNNIQTVLYSNSQGWQPQSAPGGSSLFEGLGLNKSGQLLAYADLASPFGPYSEFYLYDPNKGWTDIGDIGYPNSFIYESLVTSGALSDSGQAFIDAKMLLNNNVNQIYSDNNVNNSNSSQLWPNLNPPSGYSNPILASLNNAGQILVDASTGSGSSAVAHLFLYDSSSNTWTDLNSFMPSGIALTGAGGIDSNGDIVADGSDGHIYLLQPDAAPKVTTQPANQTVTAGGTATFTAAASGVPTPTVQWQYSKDGSSWANVGSDYSTSTTVNIENVITAWNGYQFRAVFSNLINGITYTATSNAATLTVQTAPAITSGSSAAFTVGQNGSFTVTATGSPTPKLTVSGVLPNGVTFTDNGDGTAILAGTPAAGTQKTYQFTITASNGAGNDPQSFTLTVNPASAPPSLPSSPSAPPSSQPSPPAPPTLNVPPFLALFDSLLGGTETINPNNGTETITDSLFGITLLTAIFDHTGHLVSVSLLGIDVTFLFA